MALYKQVCQKCGQLIDGDSRFCCFCGSHSPFGYLCPTCLRPVEKNQRACAGCGRALYIPCPHCGQMTFVQDSCEKCGKSLMVKCSNPRCGVMQFFDINKCTACGKKIKAEK